MVGSATEVEEVATEVGGAGPELVGLGAHATGAAASAAHAIRAPVILFIPTGRYRASSRPATAPQPDLGTASLDLGAVRARAESGYIGRHGLQPDGA